MSLAAGLFLVSACRGKISLMRMQNADVYNGFTATDHGGAYLLASVPLQACR
jgi:hypothetical protein